MTYVPIREMSVCDIQTQYWMTKGAMKLIIIFVNSNAHLLRQLPPPQQLPPLQLQPLQLPPPPPLLLLPTVREKKGN